MPFSIEDWNIEAMTGYKPLTTYYSDFSIAEKFGEKAIQDTYNQAFKNCKDNYKYITEIVMVLNWKMWRWSEENVNLSKLYEKLWTQLDDWCQEHLKGEELSYFYHTTD